MRKNHHGKKDRLVKRVFALCLALAVICTCLVPVFATEGLIDPQVNQEASRPVDDGEASYPDDEVAGFGGDEAAGFGDDFPAVDDGEPREVYDEGEAAGFGEDEVATRPVEGGEDNLDGGPSVKETEWGTVIEYDTSTSIDPSSSTETQWSGEDDVVEKPDDKVVVSGDEIKKLQDMVVYRFWLKELNANDLQDITAQAQINNMTESEYLARNGEVLWNLYFIQAVPRAETIADYSSYIENPSSNRDPKGELRQFDYWYTLDEFGNRVRLNLTDPTSNILDDKTTTVNVYAAWKDGTVGSDEEEDVDHEDLVDKNPVPVDLETKAAASYEDEDGNTKSATLPVEVKNLPSAADHLSVIHMGDDDMQTFYESHEDSFGKMMPILGLKISPKNAKGNTVQPAKGEKATVTVSGLDKLPEMEGATANTLKVLHETSDGNVEILDVLTYTNGTLTFETSSFSPFVVVRTDGYDVEPLNITADKEMVAGETIVLTSTLGTGGTWSSNNTNVAEVNYYVDTSTGKTYFNKATVYGKRQGTATITYTVGSGYWAQSETYEVKVKESIKGTGAWVYLYAKVEGDTSKLTLNGSGWFTLGKVWVPGSEDKPFVDASTAVSNGIVTQATHYDSTSRGSGKKYFDNVLDYVQWNISGEFNDITRYEPNQSVNLSKVRWEEKADSSKAYGLIATIGANYYVPNDKIITWHFDGYIPAEVLGQVTINYYIEGTNKQLKNSEIVTGTEGTTISAKTYSDLNPYLNDQSGKTYEYVSCTPESVELKHGEMKSINLYYRLPSADLTISKTVTGKLGDTNKAFTFTVRPADSSKTLTITDADIIGKSNDNVTFDTTNNTFTLAHDDYITLSLPVGSYVVEETAVDNYTTKYKIGSADEASGNRAEVTLGDTDQTVAFTNHCTLKPDTGVLLDTLPYLVILAVVAGGVALLMLRKHRKEDD